MTCLSAFHFASLIGLNFTHINCCILEMAKICILENIISNLVAQISNLIKTIIPIFLPNYKEYS